MNIILLGLLITVGIVVLCALELSAETRKGITWTVRNELYIKISNTAMNVATGDCEKEEYLKCLREKCIEIDIYATNRIKKHLTLMMFAVKTDDMDTYNIALMKLISLIRSDLGIA